MEVHYSIDKITLCGDKKIGVSFEELHRWIMLKGWEKRCFNGSYPFDKCISFVDGSLLQTFNENEIATMGYFRYEYNPNKAKENKEFERLQLHILTCLSNVRITRLDLAADIYGRDLSVYTIQPNREIENRIYKTGSKIHAWDFGTRQSKYMIRVYNKLLEQRVKKKAQKVLCDWWRFEVQINQTDLIDKILSGEINPFEDITMIGENDISYLPFEERAIIREMINCPDGFSDLSYHKRKKYLKLFNELAGSLNDEVQASKVFRDGLKGFGGLLKQELSLTHIDTF